MKKRWRRWSPWQLRNALDRVERRLERTRADLDKYREWHWARCDCHDSWDQCPCAEGGHPKDSSCGCCSLGTGLCDPLPVPASQGLDTEESSSRKD